MFYYTLLLLQYISALFYTCWKKTVLSHSCSYFLSFIIMIISKNNDICLLMMIGSMCVQYRDDYKNVFVLFQLSFFFTILFSLKKIQHSFRGTNSIVLNVSTGQINRKLISCAKRSRLLSAYLIVIYCSTVM